MCHLRLYASLGNHHQSWVLCASLVKETSSHVVEMLIRCRSRRLARSSSPLLRPRPVSGPTTSSLATIAEAEQPIVIVDDDEDTTATGAASGSAEVRQKAPPPVLSQAKSTIKRAGAD